MARLDGGRVAARGFQYQYLRTLEAILSSMDQPRHHSCRVEGPVEPASHVDPEVVDFDLVDEGGRCLFAAQVKSAGNGRNIGAPDAISILIKLVESCDAGQYWLITQARPDQNCRQLAANLREHREDPALLHYTLTGQFARAPKVLRQLTSLPPAKMSRLCRAHIEFDQREVGEIREDLHRKIQDQRVRMGAGIGEYSGGLVLGYLISETLRRAADPSSARWAFSQFRQDISVGDEVLRRALGRQDWGIVAGSIPQIPDILRIEPSSKIAEILNVSPNPKGAGVPTVCAVTGLSGVGKSSLAAAHVASYAYRYNLIFWVDASTEDALIASFYRLLQHLTNSDRESEPHSGTDYLRELVHSALQKLPGRWLLVFDDASPNTLINWLPKLGRGDVIITSSIKQGWRKVQGRVEVDGMTQVEARDLLVRRLMLEPADIGQYSKVLDGLARSLEFWPLALELASGYIVSCEISIKLIENYQEMILRRAVSDNFSVPAGYPRTLVSAINLGIDRLIAVTKAQNNPILQPLAVLGHLCFLNSSRIPTHLAVSSAFIPSVNAPSDPPNSIFVDESTGHVHENVRLLSNYYFLHHSKPLAESHDDVPGGSSTVSINSVLQYVLRQEFEAWGAAEELISNAAFHTERWLRIGIDLGWQDWTWEIAQHAASLAKHIRRLSVKNNRTAILLGNLATFHYHNGKVTEAIELLELELTWLTQIRDPNILLAAQSKIELAELYLSLEMTEHDELVLGLLDGDLYGFIEDMAQEGPEAAAYLATQVSIIVQNWRRKRPNNPAVADIGLRYSSLAKALPNTEMTALMNSLASTSSLLSGGSHSEAERVAREILSDEIEGSSITAIEIRRLLIEALVGQFRWREAGVEFDRISPYIGPQSIHQNSMKNLLHNTGLTCALCWTFTGDDNAGELLCKIVDACGYDEFRELLSPYERARFILLEVVASAARQNFEYSRAKIASLMNAEFAERDVEKRGWETLLKGLPVRLMSSISKRHNDAIQEHGDALLSVADDGMHHRIDRALQDVTAHAYAVLSSHPALVSVKIVRSGDPLREFRGRSAETSAVAVLIVQPRTQVVAADPRSGTIVELRIQQICASGFRRVDMDGISIPFASDWMAHSSGRTIRLVDGGGKSHVSAKVAVSEEWRNAARVRQHVLVFFGYGFALDEARDRARIFGSAETWRETFFQAARSGLLAAGFIRWVEGDRDRRM